jgi:hypothetical protein
MGLTGEARDVALRWVGSWRWGDIGTRLDFPDSAIPAHGVAAAVADMPVRANL